VRTRRLPQRTIGLCKGPSFQDPSNLASPLILPLLDDSTDDIGIMSMHKSHFTPIPPDVDIPNLVHSTPNFQWCHREDARLHSHPFHKLNQIIHSVTIEQGLPIVVDNWHLRNDWNAALFSKEWLDRQHGRNGTHPRT